MSRLTRIAPIVRIVMLSGCVIAAVPIARAAGPAQEPAAGAALRQQALDLRKYLGEHPNDAAAHLRLAQMYIDEARYPVAEDQAKAATQDSQYKDQGEALLAWSIFLQNDRDRLIRTVKPGNREPHAESIVRMSLGLALLDPFDMEGAGTFLRDAVRLDPSSWRAHMALARYLILVRKLPEAREQLDAARGSAGHDEVGVTRIAAELDRANGDLQGAVDKYSEVIKAHPSSVPALAGRADALISLDRLADAQNDVAAAMRIVRNPNILFLYALILAREGKFDQANVALQKVDTVLRRMPIGYYLYGVVNYWLGHPETAESNLSRFQAKQPNVSAVGRLRAQIALQRKDALGAIAILKPMIEANPADRDVADMLARAYLTNAQPDEVISLYQRVATAPPPHDFTSVNPGDLIMIYGDAAGDVREIEKVVMKSAPGVVAPMADLRHGDVSKAADVAEALAKAQPGDPWVQNLLGVVRMAQKRPTDAEAIFRGILGKRPNFTPAAFNLVEVLVTEDRLDDARALLKEMASHKLDDATL